MATPEQFSRQMFFLANKIERQATLAFRKTVIAVDQAIVSETPVKTGRARSNWIPSIDSPSDATTEDIDETGSKAMEAARQLAGGVSLGQRFWISNNLPYIVPLNEGHSDQAPSGYVEDAIKEGFKIFENFEILKDF